MTAGLLRATRGVGIAFVFLALVELGLRLALGPPPPPVQVVGAPHAADGYLSVANGIVTATYLRVGPGGPVYTFPVQPVRPRVVFLGASSVFGFNVLPEERFSDLLAAKLPIEQVNLAAPAMDSFDLVRVAAELDKFTFSAAVLYEGHNDVGNAYFQERYSGYAGGLRAYGRQFFERSQVYCQLRLLIAPLPHVVAPAGVHAGMTPARLAATAEAFAQNLRRIHWMLEKRGVPLILVTPASNLLWRPATRECGEGPDCSDALWRKAMAAKDENPEEAARMFGGARDIDWASTRAPAIMAATVRKVAASEGLLLVDAEQQLPRAASLGVPDERLFMDQLHFSREGHRAMAELIAPTLRTALRLPE